MEEPLNDDFRLNACTLQPHAPSPHHQDVLEIVWWTNVVCLPTIAVIGFACNTLNFVILTGNTSARRIPSWHLLVALAVCDVLFLVFATLEVTPMSVQAFVTSNILNSVYTHVALYVRFLASTFYKASVLIVVAFNVERYVCVCHPLAAHRFCTSRRSKQAIAISFLVSLVCSAQWPLVYRVVDCWDEARSYSYNVIVMSDSQVLQTYYKVMDYFSLFAFNVAPIVVLCCLNSRLITTLRRVVEDDYARANNNSADCPDTAAQRFNANAMLFAVVALLFVCVGPQAPARLLYEFYGHYHETAVIYTCISQQMVFVNAALNFCLYCLVSKRYRILFRESLLHLLAAEKDLCTSTGLHLKTKFTSLPSPTLTIVGEESMPMIERRASAQR